MYIVQYDGKVVRCLILCLYKSMQGDRPQPTEVKALILIEVEHVFMHRLLAKEKNLFTSGTCKVARLDSGQPTPAYFLNIGSFYYGIHKNIYFVKVSYEGTVSYVFPHFQHGLSALSLLFDSPSIPNFEEILSNAARLLSYQEAMTQADIQKAIQQHCPTLEKEQIYYPDSIKKAITTSGKFFNSVFTTVGGYLKSGVEKAGNYLNTKIEAGEPTHVKPQTKEKWETLKNGTNKVIQVSSDLASKIFTPVIEKTKEYTSDLKTKIERSENGTVKYAKELVQVSGRAIEQAFEGLVKGGTEVTKELGEQSKKLITKKYGDEVINVFTEQQKEEMKEKEEAAPQAHPNPAEQSQVRLQEKATQDLDYPSLLK